MAGMDKSYFLDGKPSSGAEVNQAGHAGTELLQMLPSTTCVRVFVAGAVTHVGKTSVCLGLLAALRKAGLTAQELAYIKPATQCEAPDLLSKWCAKEGIEYVAGEEAPLVFYSGFTRSFLAGEQGTSAQWLQKIEERIQKLSDGKRVVIVDGVGFPAVGSIVGVDNADVARASRAPVLLVCKSGVGSAVDSFSLNSSYFLAKSVPVLGAVFNLGEIEGFYSWDKCRESIEAWFALQGGRRERFYGVVPKLPELDGLRERIKDTGEDDLDALADMNAVHFAQHVDIAAIFADAAADPWCRGVRTNPQPVPTVKGSTFQPLSRDAVSATAKKSGAKGGQLPALRWSLTDQPNRSRAPLAWHRDVNSHNVLICNETSEDGTLSLDDGEETASFWLCDLGLAVDSQSWIGEENLWRVTDIGGDCRYWPASCWMVHCFGADYLEERPNFCRQYKSRLDIHALGITAIEVLCTKPLALRTAGAPAGDVPSCWSSLLDAWKQYHDTVSDWWQAIYSVFSAGGDFRPVHAWLVEIAAPDKVVTLVGNMRQALYECADCSDEAVAQLLRAVAAAADEDSQLELLDICKLAGQAPETGPGAALSTEAKQDPSSTAAADVAAGTQDSATSQEESRGKATRHSCSGYGRGSSMPRSHAGPMSVRLSVAFTELRGLWRGSRS
ncbi:unnamed protein product [Symbiodinium sp. CCMP2456]|nr:unnamed protein product [Symbiodinium sp. CCMP2456]